MSFQNQGFWVMNGAACDISCDDSSRIDPKRPHQQFMDAPEANLPPKKKQAVEVPNSLLSGMLHSGASTWGTASSFHSFSGNSVEKLFDSEASTRTVDFADRNVESNGLDRFSSERKDDSDPFGIDYSFGLSISYALDDSRSNGNYGGVRKVEVNQVKESENFVSFPVGHVFDKGPNNIMPISTTHLYDQADGNSLSTILNYNKGDEKDISTGETCDRSDVNLITVGQTYIKDDENLSTEQSYKQFDCTASTRHVFGEQDDNVISNAHTYNKVKVSAVPLYHKAEDNILSINQNYLTSENSITSICPSYRKGESTIISFGGYDDDDINPLGRLISGYELLMGQSTIKKSDMVDVDLVRSKAESLLSEAPSGTENFYKKEEKIPKKLPSNNFPSNVRSLLSTGILDGVPVKYVAWSRKKELPGVIRGSGYSCGCLSCNFSKVINAYEFERHAGCKTKHPNNHIYFENGKTVYGIVQELRSTPQGLLFEVMPTITGSPINQKSFRIWKESFLAATRELQRIYGNDEGKQLL